MYFAARASDAPGVTGRRDHYAQYDACLNVEKLRVKRGLYIHGLMTKVIKTQQ